MGWSLYLGGVPEVVIDCRDLPLVAIHTTSTSGGVGGEGVGAPVEQRR